MEENANVIEIERILKIAWEKKFYIALILLIFFVVGYYYSYYCVEPLYRSSSTILLVKSQEDAQDAVTQSDITLNQKLISTYGEIMTSPEVVSKVISNLNLTMSEEALKKSISVTSVNSTEVLKVSVSNRNASLAKSITDELINVFKGKVKEIYNIDNVNIIGKAQIATSPYNINHIRDIGIFLVIGIIANCGMILIIYLLDTTIKTEEDIEKYIGLNVLTSIPIANPKLVAGSENNELIAQTDPKSPISEVFRTLRTNIAFTQAGKNIRNILVTSSNPGEGKSWTSSNLAIIFAQANKKTILIDADMRKGRQHYIFESRNRIGLSNFLAAPDSEENIEELSNYIQTTKIPNLHIMTGGNRPPNPSELLSSDGKMKKLLDILDLIYDVVIIDGTPSDIVSDSIIISNIVDSVIIVTACKQTKMKSTQKLKRLLETSKAKIGGVVLNKVQVSAKVYKNKYYYSDSSNSMKQKSGEQKKQEIETVEQLIERANIANLQKGILGNGMLEKKQVLEEKSFTKPSIENSFMKPSYTVENASEFKFQINNIGTEISNIKQIFMQVLSDNQNQIKENALNRNEIQLLKEKLEDLKLICTNLSVVRNEDDSSKLREEIDKLEAIYNLSSQEDTDYARTIEAKIDSMKDLYYKSIEFEDSFSAKTMDKIEDVKEVINSLKISLDEKIANMGKNEDLIDLKNGVISLETAYNQKLDDKFEKLEETIIENSKVKKIEEIKNYIQDTQVEYTRELEKKFLNLQDTIIENYNSSEIASRIEELKNEYYSKLQSECIQIQNCVKDTNNSEKLEELLRDVQNTWSIELAEKINEMKDFYSTEINDKAQNSSKVSDENLSKVEEKFEELKTYYGAELKERLQNIYNLYSSDIDDGVDRIKIYEAERFDELKTIGQDGLEALKNCGKENVEEVKDKLDEMQDRYSIELTAKIDDIQEHYNNKITQLTEFNQEKFNDVKDKLDEMQDRYTIELNAKIEDIQENYTNKIDEINEQSQEKFNDLREKIETLQQTYTENIEKRILDLQKLQNQNSKSSELDEVKQEINKIQKNLDEKDNNLEDEIYTMKQELVKIRKELDYQSGKNNNIVKNEQDNNVYRYNGYNELEQRKGFFGKKNEEVDNKKPINAAAGVDSSVSQILKF